MDNKPRDEKIESLKRSLKTLRKLIDERSGDYAMGKLSPAELEEWMAIKGCILLGETLIKALEQEDE